MKFIHAPSVYKTLKLRQLGGNYQGPKQCRIYIPVLYRYDATQNGSRDPNHAPFLGGLPSLGED